MKTMTHPLHTTKSLKFLLKPFLKACLILPLALAPVLHAQHHHHETHVHPPADNVATKNPPSVPSKKFTADEPLKKNMAGIRKSMATLHHKDKVKDPAIVKAVGIEIEKIVDQIFKTCKLPPAADEAIHPVLAELLSAAQLLQEGKTDEAHAKIHHALQQYDQLFE